MPAGKGMIVQVALRNGLESSKVASLLDPFIASLIEQQYRASVIYIKARHGLALDRWLAKRRVALADLGEAQIERYQDRCRHRHRRIRTATRQIERKPLHSCCSSCALGARHARSTRQSLRTSSRPRSAFSSLIKLGEERDRHRQGPAAVPLGRQQGGVIPPGGPTLQIHRGDCPADPTEPVCTARARWRTSADLHVAQSGSVSWGTSDVPVMLSAQPFVPHNGHRPRCGFMPSVYK
jgi:hypothetical protein